MGVGEAHGAAAGAVAAPSGATDVLAPIRAQFAPGPGVAYLDAATYGLPPRATIEVLRGALDAWQAGEADWIEDWDRPSDAAREHVARLIDVDARSVATIPATSVGSGLVGAMLGPGDEVVVPGDEMTSNLFPLLVAARRGTSIREVPFEEVAGSVGPGTTLVATSLVQMQTGRVADIDGILDAAERHGTRVLVDGTQGIPFVDLAGRASRIDFLVCSNYKHLLCPRGTGFLVVREDRWPELQPLNANWRAADEPFGRYFGGPLTLADDARMFDVSRAWLPWIGATTSLGLLAEWRAAGAFPAVLELARGLAARIGVPWLGATLVSAPLRDGETARRVLREAGIRASVRGTGIRFSTHVYTTEADLDRAAEAIAPFRE